jgi:hypothetical protein
MELYEAAVKEIEAALAKGPRRGPKPPDEVEDRRRGRGGVMAFDQIEKYRRPGRKAGPFDSQPVQCASNCCDGLHRQTPNVHIVYELQYLASDAFRGGGRALSYLIQ